MSSRVDPNSVTITTTADARHEHDQIIRNADRAAIQYVAEFTNNNGRATIVGARPPECPRSSAAVKHHSIYLLGLEPISIWLLTG